MTGRGTADKVRIAQWLERQGLDHYARAFEEQNIGFDVLSGLGDEDLKELGVPLGDRKRLLKAIADLRTESAGDAMTSAAARGQPIRHGNPERRQLTLLFCDLVASTELSACLDPEDLREVVHAYQACVAAVVERFEGHVAKYLGDGVLVYFGYPRAHEDDAERAVRSGLALVDAVSKLTTPADEALAARVGIATGPVVVGDLICSGAAREEVMVGETPNLAARLRELAGPGAVVIAPTTRRLVGGLFELAELGPVRLKGFAEPLAAFRVAGEGRAESRFEALHGHSLTPLVGREPELAILLKRWAFVKEGTGQVVLVSGEPGIGKSRLIWALRQELSGEPHLAVSHFCSPYHTNTALHPIITQLERAAGFAPDDEPETKLAKLERLLGQATSHLDEAVPLIAALLGVPSGELCQALNLSPQQQKQRTLEVLMEQLAGLARNRPVLDVYEDAHWAGPSTLELLDLLVERVRTLPVLAVLTYRPEFIPPWTGYAHVTSLTLSRLGQRHGAQMIERLTGSKPLPGEVLQQILAKTDGVPLFVEELTKAVLESGLLKDEGGYYAPMGPLRSLAIPATLQDSLMARLDRLGPVKEVAQIGAVIGREFSHELLAAVAPLDEAKLQDALRQLTDAELVFRLGTPPEASYSFKHALVQEAAYQSLLRSSRRQVHARIAQALEEHFPGIGETQPEVLAHHLTAAGLREQAITYWERAGRHAAGRFANPEAIGHFTAALELIEALPEGETRDRQELRLQVALTVPLIAAYGFGSTEVERCAKQAKELSDRLSDAESRFTVTRAVWNSSLLRRPVPDTVALSAELLLLAEAAGDPAKLAVACRSRGYSLLVACQLDASRDHLARGIELADPVSDARFRAYGEHPAMVCRTYAAQTLTILGMDGRPPSRTRQSTSRGGSRTPTPLRGRWQWRPIAGRSVVTPK